MITSRTSRHLLLLFVLCFAAACAPAPIPPGTGAPPPDGTGSAASATLGPQETTGTPPAPDGTATRVPASGPVTLRIWLPPAFTPDPETAPGQLLDAQLDEFALLHPGIRITVRLKDELGAGGMVSSLAATADAVPEALPDLILIPRLEMERAVMSQLLQPFDQPLEPEWYDFARSLASVDGTVYGRPFAADALVQFYRPDAVLDPPRDWTTTLNTGMPLLFAAGSKDALFTLALYEAAGGQLLDENQQPYIDLATLAALFNFFADGAENGVFPRTISEITSPGETYSRFQSGEENLAISWVSYQLGQIDENTAVAGLPTVTNVPYTMVNGWMWVLSNPEPARLALAQELAAFLTTPEFISSWTASAGYLPPRADALSAWPDSPEASLASRLVLAAHPLPSIRVVEKVGPILQQLTIAVLRGEMTPAEAAAAAAARVNSP